MTLGQDWPIEELQDVLQAHNLRILGRERRRTGPAPWWNRSIRTRDGRRIYDPDATWTETHYTFRREVGCDVCGHRFGYNFEVDQISQVHQAGRGTDGALRQALGRQLRRRLRCPDCGSIQREPRLTLVRAERNQTRIACSLIVLGILGFAALGALGGWLGGIPGFFIGLGLAVVGLLVLWYYAFPYILSIGPTI